MRNSVIKGAGYVLVHVPGMLMQHGTTQTTERRVNPDSDYLKAAPAHLRSYEDVLSYPPNQAVIGNLANQDLAAIPEPWYDKKVEAERFGPFGEIMPEEEFILLMQICDAFDLVHLEEGFVSGVRPAFEAHPLMKGDLLAALKEGTSAADIEKMIADGAEEISHGGQIVGCVKRAHDVDVNLSAHVIFENLVSKASAVLTTLHLMEASGLDPAAVDYVIECSEEACGDMNQRGGGNFAKAVAETAGLSGATGSDTRAFCAAPTHALVEAASLVKAGTFKNVVVVAGGSTAKLGMNGKDHVKKGLPLLEDCLGGFAALICENDGINPEINLDILGRHTVGTGSSPQAVIESLVTKPLMAAGMTITDVDKYSPEMQNPDITKPAGAGDVPEANYKMIGALGVKLGQIQRQELPDFVKKHGLKGFAPTQGHIPSGVPYLGFARQEILDGSLQNAMIIGKGSLFLGRMTNLFDGISFFVQKNPGLSKEAGEMGSGIAARRPVIGLAVDSELGEEVVQRAASAARRKGFPVEVIQGEDRLETMDLLLRQGRIDAAVAAHYPFPIGVATVGRLVAPATGREVYLATTTGSAATDRTEAMVRGALAGIIAAKAGGIEEPTVGILNVDGARQCERLLGDLARGGYPITLARSMRSDGGAILRGNDLLAGSADVVVTDSLTGNLLMKVFSAFTTGGGLEVTGSGYGPGIGQGYGKKVLIVSRASGEPVIASAIEYAAQMVEGDMTGLAAREYALAEQAGLTAILAGWKERARGEEGAKTAAAMPEKETCTAEIHGVEVMELDEAVEALWAAGIYAESGMGCTGPVVLVADPRVEKAQALLKEAGFLA